MWRKGFQPIGKMLLEAVSFQRINATKWERTTIQPANSPSWKGTFTPLIGFHLFWGNEQGVHSFLLTSCRTVSRKKKTTKKCYCISGWLKTRFNFSLLRSCTLCVRGSRSYQINREGLNYIDISQVVHESKFDVIDTLKV